MSVTGSSFWGAKLLARALTSEGMLGFTGCAMAVASGSFALYMNMHVPATSHDPSSTYFTVFAQLSPRAKAARTGHPDVPAPVMASGDEIDPVVTGSIPRSGKETVPPSGAGARVSSLTPAKERPILPNVLLRQIDGDNALVEMNDSLVVYKIGDEIPGAGRLIAMTRQAGRPALETSRGLIVESR